jgi:threonine aldolase
MNYAKGFASDNHSGVHPKILDALTAANGGRAAAYGGDDWTARVTRRFQEIFGADTAVSLVFNGTAANILSLRTVTDRYHAVYCAEGAHLDTSECGAPEHLLGCTLITIPTHEGKLRPEDVAPRLKGFGDQHASQPRVLSIAQATEMGTVYRPDEVRALADLVHRHGMLLHMDGARLVNAAAALDLDFKAFTKDAGVDVLSFGGTKAGMMFGEAVLVFDPKNAAALPYLRKQNLQLASKMRFIAAQFLALLDGGLWREMARHSNAMARVLADGIQGRVKLAAPVETNAVFAILPDDAIETLQNEFAFHAWDDAPGGGKIVRWMTAFDTRPEDVKEFVGRIREVMA